MRERSGFTLLEMLIAMAVISLVMVGVFGAFSIALRLFTEETNRTDVFIEADRSMSRMTKELREAKQVVGASSREVSFWLDDLNGNGTMDAFEIATFRWSGSSETSLNRTLSNETIPIAYGIYDFQLTYDSPGDPKLITIKLLVGKGTIRSTLESSVKPRNL